MMKALNKILEGCVKHKILLVSMLLIWSYTFIIHTDYVSRDAAKEQSDQVAYVTQDASICEELHVGGKKLQGITMNIGLPEVYDGHEWLELKLLEDNSEVANIPITFEMICEAVAANGKISLYFDHAYILDKQKNYSFMLVSNSENDQNSYQVALDTSGEIWKQQIYLVLTKEERKSTFLFWGEALVVLAYIALGANKWNRKMNKPENYFVFASLFLGVLYLVCVPVFQVPDEVNHYVRAYGIVHGYLLTPKDGMLPIPYNLIPYEWHTYSPYFLFHNWGNVIDGTSAILHNNVNMALYSPVSYVLQIIGIGIGEIISDNTYVLVHLGSLANMLGCTAIIYYAIKLIPYGKNILMVISLLPMAIQERASLSVDGITYALVVLVMAYCLWIRAEELVMNRKHYIILYSLLFMVSSCKVVYFVAGFMILLIPNQSFGNRMKGIIHKVIGCLLVLINSVGWFAIANGYLANTRAGGSSQEKVDYILNNTDRYLYILDKTFWLEGFQYAQQLIGSQLGSLNIQVNDIVILLFIILICKIYYQEKNQCIKSDNYVITAYMLLSVMAMILLIATSLYIQWTDIGASTYSIEGLQGRYFLPILPFVLIAFMNKSGEAAEQRNVIESVFMIVTLNLLALADILAYSSIFN